MGIGNVIVGQSGGPTSVINSSLAGVFKAARDAGAGKIYGMRNGVEGLIGGQWVDLAEKIPTDIEVELLKRTPSSYLGTCRFKLKEEADFEKIFKNLKSLDIKAFFYAGGNDSMDSINKLAKYAEATGSDIRFMGVPKTIDNDLPVTDHTPGFGSAAKYVAATMKEIMRDALSYKEKSVLIVEIMGRSAGWLTASSLLSQGGDCPGPDIVLLPEEVYYEESFVKQVEDMLKEKDTVVVAVSEGIKEENGVEVCKKSGNTTLDAFGHPSLSGTGTYLKTLLSDKLKLKRVRAIEFSAIQRSAAHISSLTDVEEAFMAGSHAVSCALAGETAKMVVFKRVSNHPYSIALSTCDAGKVANAEKNLDKEWIAGGRDFLLKKMEEYARPLIQGEAIPLMINGLPHHFVLK